ncbi:MAG: bacillithiol biosynthesis deacetylase BshB1 [Bacteroidota bacterium]
MPLDILAIAAHPDDAELGCGGSLLLATRKGLSAAIGDLSAGEMSSRGTVASRQAEAANATRILELKERMNLGLPDSKIGENSAHSLSALIQLIRETRPRIVLAPYWEDRHPDHEATGRLVKEACFFAGVTKVGHGEPYRPVRLFFYMLSYPFTPSFVLDISDVWERKLEAIKAYHTQFESSEDGIHTAISEPGFLKLMEARAIWFGSMIGTAYGEPYYMPGPVPLLDLPDASTSLVSDKTLPPYTMFY